MLGDDLLAKIDKGSLDQNFTFNQTQISKAETSRITSEIRFRRFRGERPEFPPAETYAYVRTSVCLRCRLTPSACCPPLSTYTICLLLRVRKSFVFVDQSLNWVSGHKDQRWSQTGVFLNKKRLIASSLNRAKTILISALAITLDQNSLVLNIESSWS